MFIHFLRDDRGFTTVEWALMGALVVMLGVVAWKATGSSAAQGSVAIGDALAGE